MRLCIVTRNIMKGDGQSRVNYEVAWEAINRGHHVTMLASNVSTELRKSSHVTWINIPVKLWPTQLLSDMAFSWKSAAWLHKHRSKLDVVMANGANTREQADVNAVHFVHTSWLRSSVHPWRLSRDIYGFYHWVYTAMNAHLEKKTFSHEKVIVAVSEKIKQELISIGVPQEHIQVILNGVDLEEFYPGLNDRSQLGLPEDRILALFVGDIQNSRKNLDTVLYALDQVPELHLAVVGTVKGSPYPQLVAKLGLNARVHFLGYRQDVFEIMKAVDLFVFPSRYEPFGMVVSEAMATGLPVITSTTTGAAEIVTPECGIVLPDSEDILALSEALTRLSKDHHLRDQMGHAARAIAEQHSWTSKAKEYVNLFEELEKPLSISSY